MGEANERFLLPAPEGITYQSFGVIMVKPHALETGLDILVTNILNGYNANLIISEQTRTCISSLIICKHGIVDLGDGSQRSERVLDAYYAGDSDKPHYPTLRRIYSDRVLFYIVASEGSQEELSAALKELKGQQQLVNPQGQVIRASKGIRGALLPSAMVGEESRDLSLSEQEAFYTRMLNNIVHATDGYVDAAIAISQLLREQDLFEMEARGILGLRAFIQQNI